MILQIYHDKEYPKISNVFGHGEAQYPGEMFNVRRPRIKTIL